MNHRILLVDDDIVVIKMLTICLRASGHTVFSATDGRDALKTAYKVHPDLVVLDIMMPGMNGWEVCKRLRELSDVPIIMLTAKAQQKDVINGFLLGADDYVTKPFSPKELEVRIGALLRRAKATNTEFHLSRYDDGRLRIDLERQQVFRQGEKVHLTPTEFKLLGCLLRHQRSVVSHDQLLVEIWGPSYTDASPSLLSVYIHHLRKKLEEDPAKPQYIRTDWGIGYWFAPVTGLVEENGNGGPE